MIIGLNGYAKSGKDEVAQHIQALSQTFLIKKFSGKLKYIASILTGIEPDRFEDQVFKSRVMPGWDMTAREILQKLGTEAIRDNLHEAAWVNALFSEYTEDSNWIVTDVRFQNEAQEIKKHGGVIVRVNRTGFGPVNNHESEISLDGWDFDHIIENNGTIEDLKESARILMTLL